MQVTPEKSLSQLNFSKWNAYKTYSQVYSFIYFLLLLVPFPSNAFHQTLSFKFSPFTIKDIQSSLKFHVHRETSTFPFG